jgi:PEP-CTERM motif
MKIAKFVLPVIAAGFATSSAMAASSAWSIDASNIVAGTVANALTADGAGDDWTGAVLKIDLTAGSVYNDAGFGADGPPTSAFIGLVPALAFDSYVGIIDDATAGIAGGAGDLGGGAQNLAGGGVDAASITWFNTATGDTAAVQVANITLSDDAAGSWALITSFAGGLVQTGGTIVGGALVPEPASLALMGLGGLAALRRRR